MADFRRRRWVMPANKATVAPRMIDQEIFPNSGWTDFPTFHCLLIDLPDFRKDEIKLDVNEPGTIVVRGRRKVGEEKQENFEKTFKVPEDGDIKSISTAFDGDTFRVEVPKVPEIEASSGVINGKDKKESEVAALSSSSVVKEDKPGESKGSAPSSTIQENEPNGRASSSGVKGEQIIEAKDDTKQKLNEYQKEQNGIIQGNEKELESSEKEEKITEKLNDYQGEQNDGKQRKEEEVESEKNTEKQTENQKGKNDHGEEKKKDLTTSPEKEESTEKPKEDQKEQNVRDKGKESSGQGETSSKSSVIVKIIENKGILLASIISFTLGVLLSQKYQTPPPK